MDNYGQEHENDASNLRGFIAGLLIGGLIGGLVGAAAMLLLAPQSGKKTRAQIQKKSLQVRDQATEAVEDAMEQTRAQARQITGGIHDKAKELEQRGQAIFDEQRERLSKA